MLTEEQTTLPDEVQPPTAGQDQRERTWLHQVREIAETILLTLAIFVVINTLTGRFRIEGPSMLPNLHEGQYLIINKIVYKLHRPARGDIIVFEHPRHGGRDLIKRVIGLPGETIDIRRGQVFVNDIPLSEPYITDPGLYTGHFVLGPDEYFVLGDNRTNSEDSHSWGPLKADKIIGKAALSYWPPERWGGVPHYTFPADLGASQGEPEANQ